MKLVFQRGIDSLFERLGTDATYVTRTQRYPVRVIARCPEQLFELGEGELLAEQAQLAMRVSEGFKPRSRERIMVDDKIYQITAEPCLDRHQLLWWMDVLPKNELC